MAFFQHSHYGAWYRKGEHCISGDDRFLANADERRNSVAVFDLEHPGTQPRLFSLDGVMGNSVEGIDFSPSQNMLLLHNGRDFGLVHMEQEDSTVKPFPKPTSWKNGSLEEARFSSDGRKIVLKVKVAEAPDDEASDDERQQKPEAYVETRILNFDVRR